ncbi:hypothetical protein SynMVIR181_02462 [Synechococcus sp. MVIR-18-1]|nr:hypothetical protein SynMVIR181_02462 [Synechococcus sp. MVIR-18-1]
MFLASVYAGAFLMGWVASNPSVFAFEGNEQNSKTGSETPGRRRSGKPGN